jgi:hypothetical protein
MEEIKNEIETYKLALNHIANWDKDLEYDFKTKEELARYALDFGFREWKRKLMQVAISEFQYDPNIGFSYEAFREYYTEGLNPKEALLEDIKNQ